MCFGYEQIVPTSTVFAVLVLAGLLDDVGAHEQVLDVEIGGAGLVGADAADAGGEVDDQIGLRLGEHGGHLIGVAQVVLRARRRDHGRGAPGRQRGAHRSAEETRCRR